MGDEAEALYSICEPILEWDTTIHRKKRKSYSKRGEISQTRTKTTVDVRCKVCGDIFTAKIADRKRGWARFCSKSCAATYKNR